MRARYGYRRPWPRGSPKMPRNRPSSWAAMICSTAAGAMPRARAIRRVLHRRRGQRELGIEPGAGGRTRSAESDRAGWNRPRGRAAIRPPPPRTRSAGLLGPRLDPEEAAALSGVGPGGRRTRPAVARRVERLADERRAARGAVPQGGCHWPGRGSRLGQAGDRRRMAPPVRSASSGDEPGRAGGASGPHARCRATSRRSISSIPRTADEAYQCVDEQVAVRERGRSNRPVARPHSASGISEHDDERVEDDRRQHGGVRVASRSR